MTKKDVENSVLNELKCAKCGSAQTYIRSKTNDRRCRHCGYIQEIKKEENG